MRLRVWPQRQAGGAGPLRHPGDIGVEGVDIQHSGRGGDPPRRDREAEVGDRSRHMRRVRQTAQAVANLSLSIVLVQVWGIVGVAWGTLLPLVVIELFVLLPYGIRALNFDARRVCAETLRPQLLPLTSLALYCQVVANLGPTAGWLTVSLIAAGAGLILAATALPALRRQRGTLAAAG